VPAKKDPNLGRLELRLLFFSSLIFLSPLEESLNRVSITFPGLHHKKEAGLQASGEAVNLVSNTGSKLLVWQRQIDENLTSLHQRLQIFVL